MMLTLEQAARQGVEILANAAAKAAELPTDEAARRAWYPGGPSMQELTASIAGRRGR